MERHPSEHVSLFGTLFSDDLSSQIAQAVPKLGILDSHLLVECLFLAESSLEHVDLFTKFVVLELVLVGLSADVLITLLSKLVEFTVL